MTDNTELKLLAERVIDIEALDGGEPIGEAWGEFEAAATPAAVLALIAESDNVTGQRDRYRALLDAAGYQWLDELLGYPVEVAARVGREAKRLTVNIQSDLDAIGKHAKSIIAERDQLKAENAGLMTGYEAYERVNAELKQKVANLEVCQTVSLGMSGIIKCVAGELGFDAAGEDSAQDYLIGLARRASELKAENEALRKESDARHPFKPLHEPSIGYTGCVICGVYTDHGGLPCPKTRATAGAATGKGQQS